MNEQEARALFSNLIGEMREGHVPDLDVLPQDAKNTLLRVAMVFEPEWTLDVVGKLLPELRNDDDIETFRATLKFFRGARIAMKVLRFFFSPWGALIAVLIASLLTGLSPLELIAWYKSVEP